MTGYRISIGYNSRAGLRVREGLWAELKKAALSLCAHPERIAEEVRLFEPSYSEVELEEYERAYQESRDLTVMFYERPEEEPYIMQLASGGGIGRDIKEACRRAFARLIIQEMHRKRIEIDLVVA